jgi:alkyldihydroxyacetonephosphate synthase
MQRVRGALDETCGTGVVSCRFTHLYPDGPAPYYTVVAPSSHEDQIHHWSHIKDVVSSAIIELGGTITHHHAVGKDHVKWYHQEIPKMLLDSIERLKELYDPKSLLNPGVLLGSEGH